MKAANAFRQCKLSGTLVKFLATGLVFATGCGGLPRVVRSPADVPEGAAIIALAVDLVGEDVPVQVTLDAGCVRILGLSETTIVFTSRIEGASGDAAFDELAAVAIEPEPVTVAVAWVGEYYEFAGGRLEATITPEAGRISYLGTVRIGYGEGAGIDVYTPPEDREHDVVGALPRAAWDMPPHIRYLTSPLTIVNDEPAARQELERRFGIGADRFVNQANAWRRVAPGGILGGGKERPAAVVAPR
jgi:hypothetical protein